MQGNLIRTAALSFTGPLFRNHDACRCDERPRNVPAVLRSPGKRIISFAILSLKLLIDIVWIVEQYFRYASVHSTGRGAATDF